MHHADGTDDAAPFVPEMLAFFMDNTDFAGIAADNAVFDFVIIPALAD
jgi:hypothetical protein